MCLTKWLGYRLALHSHSPSFVPAWLRADYDRWCRQRTNLSSLHLDNYDITLWVGVCSDDGRLRMMAFRLDENKTTIQQIYYFEFHHCISHKSKSCRKTTTPKIPTQQTSSSRNIVHNRLLGCSSDSCCFPCFVVCINFFYCEVFN